MKVSATAGCNTASAVAAESAAPPNTDPSLEQLVPQACQPRFIDSERCLVYATPVSVKARD